MHENDAELDSNYSLSRGESSERLLNRIPELTQMNHGCSQTHPVSGAGVNHQSGLMNYFRLNHRWSLTMSGILHRHCLHDPFVKSGHVQHPVLTRTQRSVDLASPHRIRSTAKVQVLRCHTISTQLTNYLWISFLIHKLLVNGLT